jgi:hypothetical protein
MLRPRAFVRCTRERRDWAAAHQRRLLLFLFSFYFLLLFLKVFQAWFFFPLGFFPVLLGDF